MKKSFKLFKLALVLLIGSLFILGSGDDTKPTKVIEVEINQNPVTAKTYFDGVWEGELQQGSSRNRFSIKVTINSTQNIYKFSYPSLKGGGILILRSMDKNKVEFKGKVKYDNGVKLSDNFTIIIIKTNSNQANIKWSQSYAATGTIERDEPLDSNPLKLYPKYPVISTDGDLQITSVLSSETGTIESTDENELFVNYKVADENLVTVTSSGYLVANGPIGTTKVTVTMTDSTNKKLGSRDIEVEVVKIDVKKIVLSPDISLLAKGESQIFSVIGINGQGPTEVEDTKLSFTYDNKKISLSENVGAIVTATAKEKKGYTFLTPSYTESGKTITGNSSVIEFHTKPNIATPGHVEAGQDADFIRVKKGSLDNLYIVHEKEDLSEIILTSFDFKNANPWTSTTIINSGSTTFISPKLFIFNKVLNVIALEKTSDTLGNLILLSEESNGAWSDKKVLLQGLSLDSDKVLDLITIKNEILLTIKEQKRIGIYKVTDSSVSELFAFDTLSTINSIDLTQNRKEELRIAIAEENKLFYITRQDNQFYIQTITNTGATQVKLIYTKRNIPIVLYSTNNGLEKRNMSSGKWSGATKINGTLFNEKDFLKKVTAFDAVVDRFNNLKISLIDDDKLYYIKQYKDRSKKDAWRKTKIVSSDVGANSLSLKMDNKNRIKVVYKNKDEKWIDYWAEPQFFKYRDKRTSYENRDDKLIVTKNGAIKLLPANSKPVANAGIDITVDTSKTITLNASGSTDSDGTIKTYVWHEKEKELGKGKSVELLNLSVGKHEIVLSVTDDRGAVAKDTIIVIVTRIAGFPIAVAGDDIKVYPNESIKLNASSSSDDGSIKSYVWSENGQELGTSEVLNLTDGLALGEHIIQLSITDDKGNVDIDEIVVEVVFKDKVIGQTLIIANNYGTVKIDNLVINNKSGIYQTNSGCQADLFYTEKEDGWILFNRTITAGDCTKDCFMKIQEDASNLQLVCGSSVNWTKSLTTQKIIDTLKIITNYAKSSSNQKPILSNYSDLGVTGVTKDNLIAVNKDVENSYYSTIDEVGKVQSHVDKIINSHNRVKAYADDNTKSQPSVVDYENLSFNKIITGGNLKAINVAVEATSSVDVNSIGKLKTMVDKIIKSQKIIYNYAYSSNNQKPILSDYFVIAVIGATEENLVAVNTIIDSTYYANVQTVSEVQALVNKVTNSHSLVQAYADDNTKSQPSVSDYENLGFENLITGGNLHAINVAIDKLDSDEIDDMDKIQALIENIVTKQKIIYNFANSSSNQKPILSDYIDIAVTGVTEENLIAVNRIVEDTYYGNVQSVTEVQNLVDKVVNSHNRLKSYADDNSKSQPSVVDYNNLSFDKVITSGNLKAINVAVDNSNSVGVDSITKLKIMVDKIIKAQKIIQNYAYSSASQVPILSDYIDISVTGVSSSNIGILNEIVESTYYGNLNTVSRVQSLVDNL